MDVSPSKKYLNWIWNPWIYYFFSVYAYNINMYNVKATFNQFRSPIIDAGDFSLAASAKKTFAAVLLDSHCWNTRTYSEYVFI